MMTKTTLNDGTPVFCLRKPEAKMLDHHVDGYLQNGISIDDNAIVFDVGANVGVFGIRAIQKAKNVSAYCFEPIPDIFSVLKKMPRYTEMVKYMYLNLVFLIRIRMRVSPISQILQPYLLYILSNGRTIHPHFRKRLREL